MTATATPIDRARALLAARGQISSAKTLRGLLRALRTQPRTAFRTQPRATLSRTGSIDDLLSGFDQGRARTRTVGRYTPLMDAIAAALGQDHEGHIRAVPNSYRGRAEGSYSAAARYGQAVCYTYGRTTCPHTSYGHGGTKIEATPGCLAVRAKSLLALLPKLPRGYRWDADNQGIRILRMIDGADYHAYTEQMLSLIDGEDIAPVIAELDRLAVIRQAKRREAEAAIGALDGVWVCRADSIRAGNCPSGTDRFIASNRLDATRHYRASTLMRLATGEPRLALVVAEAKRRHAREIESGVCLLSDHR